MPTKIADIAARRGTYTKDGAQKGRYSNVGTLMQWDDGSQTLLLDPAVDYGMLYQLQRMDSKARGQEPRDSLALQVFSADRDASATPKAPAHFDDLGDEPF